MNTKRDSKATSIRSGVIGTLRALLRFEGRGAPSFASTLVVALLCALALAPAAQAQFGLSEFDVTYEDQYGHSESQAGAHPFALTTKLHFISNPTGEGGEEAEQEAKDFLVNQVPGFIGNLQAVPQCTNAQFLSEAKNIVNTHEPGCPDSTAIGYVSLTLSSKTAAAPLWGPVYNLVPPPGKASKIGFMISTVRVPIELTARRSPPYNVFGGPTGIPS